MPNININYNHRPEIHIGNALTFRDRCSRVCNRLSGCFGIVSIYPVLVLQLREREISLTGNTATMLERVYEKADKIGNVALVASIALAIFAWISSSQMLITAFSYTFTATFISKGAAFLSTLSADYMNETPIMH